MLNVELSRDPPFVLLGIYPREMKTQVVTEVIIIVLFIMAKKWKQSKYLSMVNG
jgi:hypothetical protein